MQKAGGAGGKADADRGGHGQRAKESKEEKSNKKLTGKGKKDSQTGKPHFTRGAAERAAGQNKRTNSGWRFSA
jgi:hypothetical protein